LFAGIGGFRQALDPLGGQCVFASEIDKFAQKAYTALYGDDHLHGDITQVDEKDVPNHDVLVGGFPCQAFSVAGKRLGFADETRGTLFFEIIRIMREKKPKVALLENVKGLVGHDSGRTLDTVVTALNEIGYTIDFNVLNSKYFGVPQNRERIFIIAIRDDLVDAEEWRITGTNVVAKGKRRIAQIDGVKTFNFDWPEQAEVTSRLRDILEDSVDEKYYLSEEKTAKLVAQLNERESDKDSNDSVMVGHADIRGNDSIKRVYSPVGVSPTLTTMGGGHRESKIAEEQPLGEIDIVGYCKEGGYKANEAVYGGDGVMSTLCARDYKDPKRILLDEEVRPVLTPDRAEKRQNGRRFKEDGEEAFTLTAQDKHGVALGVAPKYRIRKLTPLECWRLQGFSDEAHALVKDAGISDSQRYKQAGNAVTVNVIDAIGKRLITYL
jgi:DNA (cytosine-5)-methyltransferase 1